MLDCPRGNGTRLNAPQANTPLPMFNRDRHPATGEEDGCASSQASDTITP